MSDKTISENTIVIERTFDAPIELVWQMWTEPEHFKNWYGPQGFSIPVAEIDLRVGGKRLVCMQTPDGSMKMWTTGEYKVIEAPHRLVYTDGFADENGNAVLPSAYGMNDDEHPATTEVTVILEDLGGRTKMTMTHSGVPASEQGANEGWKQSFSKMADYIASIA